MLMKSRHIDLLKEREFNNYQWQVPLVTDAFLWFEISFWLIFEFSIFIFRFSFVRFSKLYKITNAVNPLTLHRQQKTIKKVSRLFSVLTVNGTLWIVQLALIVIQDLVASGVVEYIDTMEEETTMIAVR